MKTLKRNPHHRTSHRLHRSGRALLVLLTPLGLNACVNVLVQNQPSALQTAINRGKFELDCPSVQATVLSQKTVEGFRFEGSEHTIGVRGCGKQAVYVTYCRDPNDCNALAQGEHVEHAPGPLGD